MKSVFMILFCLFTNYVMAQPFAWQWVKSGSCSGIATSNEICEDAFHNIYVTGSFTDTFQIDTVKLIGVGEEDMFLAKYSEDGELQWVRTLGSKHNDEGAGIGTDAQGNIYVGGYFSDTVMFGSTQLISRGKEDVYIAKYTPDGNVVWAVRAGSVNTDRIGNETGGLKVDKGYVYISGLYGQGPLYDTADFGSITLISPGETGIFLAKYDTSGNIVWAKSAGGRYLAIAIDIATDRNGNVFITGEFGEPSCHFDSIVLYTNATNNGPTNMFIAKYDSMGNALWAVEAGGYSETAGSSVVTDMAGNAYVTGYMSSNLTIFSNVVKLIGETDVDNGYIAKYDPVGNLLWAKNMNINTNDYNSSNHMTTDSIGNLYITGQFEGYSFVGDTETSYGANDIFVAKYDSAGKGLWLAHGGSGADDIGYSIAVGGGNVYSTGYFTGPTGTFGSCIVNGVNNNAFVAKLSAATGIWEPFKTSNNISVYPDPADGSVTVDMGAGSFTNLQVSDCIGRILYQQAVGSKGKTVVNTSGFADGLYFVSVAGSDGVMVSKKVVVEH